MRRLRRKWVGVRPASSSLQFHLRGDAALGGEPFQVWTIGTVADKREEDLAIG